MADKKITRSAASDATDESEKIITATLQLEAAEVLEIWIISKHS